MFLSGLPAGDHPRLRGEKPRCLGAGFRRAGSPPLTRGKGRLVRYLRIRCGITPAYAGKSDGGLGFVSRVEDHPRLRGEKTIPQLNKIPILGSPPLTRGKGRSPPLRVAFRRITPAYAGKSGLAGKQKTKGGDHPRLRGEKVSYRYRVRLCGGSPPLTRGKGSHVAFTTRR